MFRHGMILHRGAETCRSLYEFYTSERILLSALVAQCFHYKHMHGMNKMKTLHNVPQKPHRRASAATSPTPV